jgi:hypothetical protein
MQHRLHAGEMLGEKRAGKFHGEKLVLLVRRARRGQRLVLAMIKAAVPGAKVRALAPPHSTKPWPARFRHKFHAAGMKARGPVELALRKKIVPLDAVARAVKTAEERLPALAHVAPRVRLGERRGRAAGSSGWGGGFHGQRILFVRAELLFPRGDFF